MNNFFTLGEISNSVFTMLGDFCSASRLDAKAQSDYKNETSSAFDKYNLVDGNSRISEVINIFYKTAFFKYKGFSYLSFFMLNFPKILQSGIKSFDPRILEDFSKKEIIEFLLIHYSAFYYGKFSSSEQRIFIDEMKIQSTNSYNDILKDTRLNYEKLSEEATWSSLEKVLQKSIDVYTDEKEKFFDCRTLVQHYLFLRFKKSLKDIFAFSDDDVNNLFCFIIKHIDDVNRKVFTDIKNIEVEKNYDLLSMDFSISQLRIPYIYDFFGKGNDFINKGIKEFSLENLESQNLKFEAVEYFINSYTKITKEESDKYFEIFNNLNEDYYNKIIIPWYKARVTIFSLTFEDKKKDKELKKQACELFRKIFTDYKYSIGNNLREFLSDAIAIDVYCNPKKDIFNNSQDDTDESSIILPGKAYWDFGYAIGMFPEDSKKTYLLTYNAKQNFWTNFPPSKFVNQEKAYKVFCKETKENELELPILLEKFNNQDKLDSLIRKDEKNTRFSLEIRCYSMLSIRCLKANGSKFGAFDKSSDFGRINKYIKDKSSDILFVNDENGANALIRSLDRYKMLSYGFSDEDQLERSKIFSEYHNNIHQKQHEIIINEFPKAKFNDKELLEQSDKYFREEYNKFINKTQSLYCSIISKEQNDKDKIEFLKSELKDKIILPLIKKAENNLLDEAIVLNGRKCVSALQLAIDCYDVDIVKEILNNLPPQKDNLSEVFISHEYVTPLQYAIRKYDYLMQSAEMINRKSAVLICKREIHNRKNVSKGILDYDKDYYKQGDILFNFIDYHPFEECGLYLKHKKNESENILFEEQENLIQIIHLLADKTNPISVDTFYYLADIIDPEDGCVFKDVLDITKLLIDTGHADLSGTDFEWDRKIFSEPSQTLLAYCINHSTKSKNGEKAFQKNYGMLDFLLSKYPEKFKDIINRKIKAPGDDGKIRCDTDLHYFITNQIESIKFYNKEMNRDLNYGKQISARMNQFLKLFLKAGADFNIPDQDGKTALDYLRQYRPYMPADCLPDEIINML